MTIPDEQEELPARLRHLRANGSLAEARALIGSCCAAAPGDLYWQMERGTQSLHEGRPELALPIFETLARTEPFGGAFECALKSAELRAGQGDIAAALEMLTLATTYQPGHDALTTVRALIASQSRSAGRELVRAAIATLRAGVIEWPALQRTIELVRHYLHDAVGDLEMGLELARLLGLAGRHGEAIPVLQALATQADFAGRLESMIGLARALDGVGQKDMAWNVASEIRTAFPAHSAFPVLATELLARHGHWDDAIRLIDIAYPAVAPEHRAGALGALVEARAIRSFETGTALQQMSIAGLQAQQPDAGYANAGIVMLTKDEDDILGHMLVHHYRLGFRHFCIVDNQSSDGTASRIHAFRQHHPDALVFACYDQIVGHYQADKMGVFMDMFVRYAAIVGVALDWMFFLDTDELIACASPDDAARLGEAMADPGCDLIVFHWLLCASPTPLHATPATRSPFESFPVVKPTRPPTTKVAVRVGSLCRPTEGNHWVHVFEALPDRVWIAAEHGWLMFHFTIRSFEQLRAKVLNGGRAFLDTKGLETHGGHWKARYACYQAEGDPFIERLLHEHVQSVAQDGMRLSP